MDMEYSQKDAARTVLVVIGMTSILTALVVWNWSNAAKANGTIVIPAGNTYLGPNAPAGQRPLGVAPTPAAANVFIADSSVPWYDIQGTIYPYILSVPTTLKLTKFPNDPYDLYAIVWSNIAPESNILIGLDNLKAHATRTQYITKAKIDYVRDWWQQFGSLKGVASIDPFTNSHGLKGYRAKYFNAAGETPNTDIFFEVPGHPEYVIHLSNGIIEPALFDKIVDSVRWGK